LGQHLWNHRHGLFTFLRHPGLDATNWRAELAIRFGVILRKVWGGNRTWAGAPSQRGDPGVHGLVSEVSWLVSAPLTSEPSLLNTQETFANAWSY
jgi:hypothetical protein